MNKPFALWLTGPPGSGKSTIAGTLVRLLHGRSIDPVVLESDVFRRYFAPRSEEDRTLFYEGMVEVAAQFITRGIPVILDAAGNRRSYRDAARKRLTPFLEVLVDCPPEIRAERDARGVHIGVHPEDYEAPLHPDVRIRSDREDPESAARKILDVLIEVGAVPSKKAYRV